MQSQAVDDLFRALADRRRRLVVHYLANQPDDTASFREVADYVASHADDSPREVWIHLQHRLLPVLAETDLLEYDSRRELIQYHSNAFVESVLTTVEDA